MSNSRSRSRKLFLGTLAAGVLMAGTGIVASPSDERAMDQFVDCSDSFWAVTCGFADLEPSLGEERTIQIDNDAVCVDAGDDLIICHT